MNKSDNNEIDEILEDILFEYENGQNPHQDEDYRFERTKTKLDQYYADFYRNKILEARKDELDKAIKWIGANSLDDYYARIDDITAQLNSKGDNDE